MSLIGTAVLGTGAAASAAGLSTSSVLGALGTSSLASWMPAIGGLLSGTGSVIGGLLGASSSAEMAHEQRKTMREYMKKQAEENQRAREWSEQMSNTAHQREVADLRAAGLNPVLSATGGRGASTPSTSSNILGANDSSAQIEAQGKLMLANMVAQLGNQLSQIDLNSAYASKARADANLSVANTRYANANTAYRENENRLIQPKVDAVEKGVETGLNYWNWQVDGWRDLFGSTTSAKQVWRGLQSWDDDVREALGQNRIYGPKIINDGSDMSKAITVPSNYGFKNIEKSLQGKDFDLIKTNGKWYKRPRYK